MNNTFRNFALWVIIGLLLGIVVYTSLESGGLLSGGYSFTWEFGNYADVFSEYRGFFVKSLRCCRRRSAGPTSSFGSEAMSS